MYEMKNGLLHIDGEPVIGLGAAYYPSFHEGKYPVPPEGDRIGEMKTDLAHMKRIGLHIVRTAALGDVRLEDGEVRVRTPLIDAICREADAIGLCASVRLQGYAMNLHGHTGYAMRNHRDEEMVFDWAAFLRSSLFHPGMMADNAEATAAVARHFAQLPAVVAYQIYNEPHYPYNGVFDYHPLTVAAYRDWLAQQGIEPQDPPHARPAVGEDPLPWVRWRLFTMNALSRFLDDSARAARDAVPGRETYTCMTNSALNTSVMNMGIDYFANGESAMDTVRITSYTQVEGADAYAACCQYALAESAAALCGKHAWCEEIDARTHMPPRKACQEIYALLGAGHKGIVFYAWRGDYPGENTPLPDNCGLIYNDRTPSSHYGATVQMIAFVNRYGGMLAQMEKKREGVAVLYSNTAMAYGDAFSGDGGNRAIDMLHITYRELRRAGVCPDFVAARHLRENRLGVRLLLVPCGKEWLSGEECAQIDAFVQAGGRVCYLNEKTTFASTVPGGWWYWQVPRLPTSTLEFRGNLETEDVLEYGGIAPWVRADCRHLLAGCLTGGEGQCVFVVNIDPARKAVEDASLQLAFDCTSAVWATPQGETALTVQGRRVLLPRVEEGGMVMLH